MAVLKFKRPTPPSFDDPMEERVYRKGRLALAARIVAAEGWGIGCSMHLTCRDPQDTSAIFVIPAGKALAALRSSDLLRVDITTGEILDITEDESGWGYDVNATAIHRAIYAARPDIGGIINGQTPNARAFAMQDMTVKMIVQDSCTFYKKIHKLPLSVGMDAVNNPKAIGEHLQDGKGFIMQNRGILLVGKTIECPLSYYIRLESLCKAQLLAEAAIRGRGGDLVLVGEQEVKFTYDNNGSEHHAWLMAKPYFARQDKLTGGALVV